MRVKACALATEPLTSVALTEVFRLDVVARIALRVVVVDILFGRMPGTLFHDGRSIVKCRGDGGVVVTATASPIGNQR